MSKSQPSIHPYPLVDSHCHLDFPAFDGDRDEVLEEATRCGVMTHIVPAITKAFWPRVENVVAKHANLFATYGLHPMFMADHQADDLSALARWLGEHPEAVGIGECGLDYFIKEPDKSAQRFLFEGQLEVAHEHSLPIVIHARNAVEDVIACIRAAGHHQGMVHSFNGSKEQASRLIDLGYSMSFGGAVTYDRAKKLRRLITSLPLDSLLLETDSPDQCDSNHQGQRNQPSWLVDVFNTVCELRSEDASEIAAATTSNAMRLFKLPHRDPVN